TITLRSALYNRRRGSQKRIASETDSRKVAVSICSPNPNARRCRHDLEPARVLRGSSNRLRHGRKHAERICVGGAGDAAFGEDGGDVAGGGDVERGMRGVDVGRDGAALEMR